MCPKSPWSVLRPSPAEQFKNFMGTEVLNKIMSVDQFIYVRLNRQFNRQYEGEPKTNRKSAVVGKASVVGVPAARCVLSNSAQGQCSRRVRLRRLCLVAVKF